MRPLPTDSYSDIKAIAIGLIVAFPIIYAFKYVAIILHALS